MTLFPQKSSWRRNKFIPGHLLQSSATVSSLKNLNSPTIDTSSDQVLVIQAAEKDTPHVTQSRPDLGNQFRLTRTRGKVEDRQTVPMRRGIVAI